MRFVLEVLSERRGAPESIRDLVHGTAVWLIRVSGSDVAAGRNISVLCRQLLQQNWINSSSLPFVLQGLRSGAEAEGRADDEIFAALLSFHRHLSEVSGHESAAQFMFELVRNLSSEDRLRITHLIFTDRGSDA